MSARSKQEPESARPSEAVTAAKSGTTPESATSLEKSRRDDRAVSKAVKATGPSERQGTTSVLPGPPIPPRVQADIREKSQRRGDGETKTSQERRRHIDD